MTAAARKPKPARSAVPPVLQPGEGTLRAVEPTEKSEPQAPTKPHVPGTAWGRFRPGERLPELARPDATEDSRGVKMFPHIGETTRFTTDEDSDPRVTIEDVERAKSVLARLVGHAVLMQADSSDADFCRAEQLFQLQEIASEMSNLLYAIRNGAEELLANVVRDDASAAAAE